MRSTTAGERTRHTARSAVAPGKWDQTIYHHTHPPPPKANRQHTPGSAPAQRPVDRPTARPPGRAAPRPTRPPRPPCPPRPPRPPRPTPASRPPVPAPAAPAGSRAVRAPTRTARPPSGPASGRRAAPRSASAPARPSGWAPRAASGWARVRGSRRSAAGPRRMRGGRRRGGRVLALAALAALPLAVAPGPVPARALLPLAMPVVRGRRAVPGVPPETAGPPSGTSPPRSPADWDGLARPPDPSSPTLMQPAAATTARAVAAIRTGTYKGRTGGHLRGSRSRRAQLPSPTRGHASGEADLTRARHPYPRECSRASSIPKWWAIS